MKLLIGCPIYKRDWILNNWFRCILSQSIDISNIGFVFEAGPDDPETITILNTIKTMQRDIPHFSINIREDLNHFEHIQNGRQWTLSKYGNMVNLRNSLLKQVRELEPDYYFSLDSDILVQNPNTIELLIAHIKSGADAVSPLMFMTPTGDMYPSVMNWRLDSPNKAMRNKRYPLGTYFKSDVIMAAKMMSKKVYQSVDYKVHEQGEDLGWCLNARDKGFKLYSASYIYAPHIMSIEMYENFLKHGDNRLASYDPNALQ